MQRKYIYFIIYLIITISIIAFLSLFYFLPRNNDNNIQQTITELYQKYLRTTGGKNADYIPVLAKVNPTLFAIAIVKTNGEIISIGNDNISFPLESVVKPFIYAVALQDNGEQTVTEKIGFNATGHKFNSVVAIEERPNHLQNPSVNAGALQATSLIKGKNGEEKWQRILDLVKKSSDGKPILGVEVYQSEAATNQRNRAIAELLSSYQMLLGDPLEAVDIYTKACSILVTAKQLALLGATLANNGVNPMTHEQVIAPKYVQDMLSDMVTNGMYDNSGMWFWKVGLPTKSGVSGGMLAIVPNKMAIVVFSPPLDETGNSVKGQLVIEELSKRWNLHLLSET